MLSHSLQQLHHTFTNHLILLGYHLPLFPQRAGHQRRNPSNLLPPPSPPLSLLSSCYSRGAALSPSKARTSCPRPFPTSGSTSRTDLSHLPLQLLRYFHLKSDFPLTFLQTLPSFAFHSQTSLKKKKKKKPSFLLILSSTWSNFSNCHKAKSYSTFQSPLLSQVPLVVTSCWTFFLKLRGIVQLTHNSLI